MTDTLPSGFRHIRASRVGLHLACAPSAIPPAIPVGGPLGAADEGTAAHEVFLDWVANGFPRDADEAIHAAATAHSVDADELAKLTFMAWRLWAKIAHLFPSPHIEEAKVSTDAANRLIMSGHPDIYSALPDAVSILDLKFGHLDDDHAPQLLAYSWLLAHAFPEAERFSMNVLRVRTGDFDRRDVSRQELYQWYAALIDRLNDPTYRPGPQCRYCPCGAECPAKTRLIRQANDALLAGTDAGVHLDMTALLPSEMASLYDHCQLLERVTEQVKALIKAEAAARGPLALGDGRELAINPVKVSKILYSPAAKILADRLGAEKVCELLKVSKGDVEEAIKADQPRGRKGAAVKELLAELEAAGAMTETVSERLVCRRSTEAKQIEVITND